MKLFCNLMAGSVLFLSACKDKTASETQSAAPAIKQEPAPHPEPVYAVPDTFKAALGKVFDGYAGIQIALAQDDLEKAKLAFSNMHGILHMMPIDQLDPTAKAYWDSTDARIMEVLHPMASAASLEATRGFFIDFTQVLTDAIEKIGLREDHPAYLFHCPMAKDNAGAEWLQRDTVLANPYFGASMPTCGNLVKRVSG